MNNWWNKFSQDNIFFISPDVKRGIGVEHLISNYHIICSYLDPLIPVLRKQGAKIFCLQEKSGKKSDLANNSGKLLENPLVADYIKKHTAETPHIMYFKPSLKLDLLIEKLNYKPLGNNANLNEEFENKIMFYHLVKKYFSKESIPAVIGTFGELKYEDLRNELGLHLVVQFGHGWAGKTTFFIQDEKEYQRLSRKFPETKVKVSKKIIGITILNNCCIYKNHTFVSSPAIQLSGIRQLSSKQGVTCGRQWPAQFIDEGEIKEIFDISIKAGKIMQKVGFKGYFGLDFIIENTTGKIYLSEANARLTASTPFFTKLELGLGNIPLLAYHLAACTNKWLPIEENNDDIKGSQIVFREGSDWPIISSNYGRYKMTDNKIVLTGRDYYPENLSPEEFIILNSQKEKRSDDQEIARLETKQEVLDQPGKLKAWIRAILHK